MMMMMMLRLGKLCASEEKARESDTGRWRCC
jgi:hypothetical protein